MRTAIGPTVIALLALTLAGCVAEPNTPPPSPSPEPSIDTSTWIGGVIDPVGTTWSGRDSAGDVTVFALSDDHTLDVTFGSTSYTDPNDTWSVTDQILTLDVFIDDANGVLEYTATWNPATSAIDATATTTVSAKTLTVSLAQQ